jgi:rSAM/selenodomain-associated transferase 2
VLSIVIPALNAGQYLEKTLRAIEAGRSRLACEVIVADGGSVDDTAHLTRLGEAIFIDAQRGRGRQMAAGAAEAGGDWLLFLHADTALDPGWADVVARVMVDRNFQRRAGYFRFALDDRRWMARVMEWVVAIRCRLFGLPYGDQGLLISRDFYEELGGYKLIDLMEDVDIVQRIGRSHLRRLPARAVTSADKYRRDGYVWRPLRNLFCLGLYSVGVSPRHIIDFYR